MANTRKWLILPLTAVLACTAAGKDQKEKPKFTPGPASSYPTKQTISGVTVAAVPYRSDEETEPAFGKKNPNKSGVLPILVVIANETPQALALDNLKVELITPDRRRVDARPPGDLKYIYGPNRPSVYSGPIPTGRPHVGKKKNPLADWTIEGRAFTARMLPPKESANGFFYFQASYETGSTLYITGMREAASGKELFYFEVPLDKP